jgi:lipoprotein-releasing system permease protein
MSSSSPRRGLEWYVARRYMASRHRGRLFSFITWIALGGVTIGVGALVVVIGVMSGMQEDLLGKILESSPHVVVQQQGRSLRMDDWEEVAERVRQIESVEAVAPWVLTTVTALRGRYSQSADMYGVALDLEGRAVTEMEGRIQEGTHDLGPTESGLPPVLMGSRLAARMQVLNGDTLTLIAFENLTVDVMGMPSPSMRQYEVAGTFTTGMYDYDVKNIYVPIEAAQEQLGILDRDQVSGLGVRVDDPDRALLVSDQIQSALGVEFYAISWSTTNRALFSALELEKLAMYLILTLIVVVAAFNIVSTLVMVVVDRTREIGILKSMGMTDRMILRIFMLQGLSIGIIGTTLGTALGLVLSWTLDTFEIITIPAEVYFVEKLPVSIHATDVGMIVSVSLLIAFLATIYPSLKASQLQPVQAIRHE